MSASLQKWSKEEINKILSQKPVRPLSEEEKRLLTQKYTKQGHIRNDILAKSPKDEQRKNIDKN